MPVAYGTYDLPEPEVIPGEALKPKIRRLTNWACRDRVAGPRGVTISLDLLVDRLRMTAVMVWCAVCVRRNAENGHCYPSRHDIARVAKKYFDADLTERQVEVALRKLARFGLQDVRVRKRHWYAGKTREKTTRLVWGRAYRRAGMWVVRLPRRARTAFEESRGWGGSMPGRGVHSERKSSGVKMTFSSTSSKSQVVSHNLTLLSTGQECSSLQKNSERCAPAVHHIGEAGLPPAATSPGAPVEVFEGMEIPPPYDGPNYAPGTLGIPERPYDAVLWEMGPDGYRVPTRRPVTTPPARPLTEADLVDEATLLRRMRTALEGVSRRKSRGRSPRWVRPVRPGDKRRMLEMARLLAEVPASPESWFAFSAACWRRGSSRRGMPLSYALSPARLEKHRGWFRSVSGEYAGRRVYRTETEREMNRRYELMVHHLWASEPKTPEGIKAVVDRYFPGETWGVMVAQVRREIDRDQARIDDLVRRGEFVW